MNRIAGMIGAAALLASASSALAGEQYVDGTGYAVSGYDVVAYHGLEQAPVGEQQPAPVPGRADITAEYNGARWAFASEENRETFLADPEAYVPAFDGHCAYGVSQGGKVPANPYLWRIVDGKLYLNITEQIVEFWEADIPGLISKAQTDWPGMEPNPASGNPVPKLDPALAPQG